MEELKQYDSHPLITYALGYIGIEELNYYCQDFNTKKIHIPCLKDHLIGKVGCSKTEVMEHCKNANT
jgi:hypothetical protein|tara:strand:+ start:337 stop:537 length:201 start_codon:yes stop_codon:yes gene_type:complete